MTFAQLRLYTAAASRLYRRQLRDQAVNARAAQYDKDSWTRYLKAFHE